MTTAKQEQLMDACQTTGKTYWLLDGPGITGMGSNSLLKMAGHANKGGAFLHEMKYDGSFVRPDLMWPGEPQGALVERNRVAVEYRREALKAAGILCK